ncbi:MAG TPA: hypothetical protein DHI91_01585 [Candidatus Portnoybacteria bacterium]|nr:hypothetical protein [Candidatus Portnoybacteria bacterium]
MKKRLLMTLFACVLILDIGVSVVKAGAWQDAFRQLPLAQRRAIDQVASKFGGNINGFRALYIIGQERNCRIVLPAGNNLLWTVWRDGWVSSVYRPNKPLAGKQVLARLNGELIALFYPDDKSFLFAVLDKPIPLRKIEPETAPLIKMVWSNEAYKFLNEEIYVPPTH